MRKEWVPNQESHYISRTPYFIESFLDSWLKVVILQTSMEQVESLSMAKSFQMRTLNISMLDQACFPWLTQDLEPMALNFSYALISFRILITSMLSLVTTQRAMRLLAQWKDLVVDLDKQVKQSRSRTLDVFGKKNSETIDNIIC